jgi:uncharacterized membrane-anchored protein YjiN (DUF445 family)
MSLEKERNLKELKKQQLQQEKNYIQYIEAMTKEVKERELRARFAKANWETMFYSMEAEELQPKYAEFVQREAERAKKLREEEAQKQQDLLEGIKKADETVNLVLENSPELTSEDINIDEATDNTEGTPELN